MRHIIMPGDENKQWMNGAELKAMQLLSALHGSMKRSGSKALEKRIRSIPGLWRCWRTATGLLERVLMRIREDTMAYEQMVMVDNVLKYGTIDLSIKASVGEDQVLVPAAALKTICDEAMTYRCAMCLADDKDVRRCKLRKALLRAALPESLEDTSGCVYRDITLSNEHGDYINI